ncbi:MAG: ABC transporter permease subunit [Anaerolineales bacterium]|nr:ABC transporter permease subunit [Anaerolineales bacterium]
MTQVTDLPPVLESEFLSTGAGRWSTAVRRALPAAVLFVAALGLWEAVVVLFRIEGFLLPRPSVIAVTFLRELPVVTAAGLFTLREAAGGFLLGSLLGIGVALATARWTVVSEGLLPFAIAVNSTPIVALAPIMNQWFGITNPLAKMSIVAVIVFFPVMINTVRGLTLVKAEAVELMRSYAAGSFTVLFKLRIPNALPYVFSAFKVGSTLSVIGAVVSEYFGGSREALGVYLSQQAALFHFAEAWAAIVVACLMGIAFYGLILLVERLLMPWHVSFRNTESA